MDHNKQKENNDDTNKSLVDSTTTTEIKQLELRLERYETGRASQVGLLQSSFKHFESAINCEIELLKTRIPSVETATKAEFESLRTRIPDGEIATRAQVHPLQNRIPTIELRLTDINNRIDLLDGQITENAEKEALLVRYGNRIDRLNAMRTEILSTQSKLCDWLDNLRYGCMGSVGFLLAFNGFFYSHKPAPGNTLTVAEFVCRLGEVGVMTFVFVYFWRTSQERVRNIEGEMEILTTRFTDIKDEYEALSLTRSKRNEELATRFITDIKDDWNAVVVEIEEPGEGYKRLEKIYNLADKFDGVQPIDRIPKYDLKQFKKFPLQDCAPTKSAKTLLKGIMYFTGLSTFLMVVVSTSYLVNAVPK